MRMARILSFLIPNPDESRDLAARLREEHPGLTPEQIAHKTVASAKRMAAGTGALMGLAGSPVTWIPAAAADAAAVLKIEGRMAGTIAALLDPDILDDPQQFQADVIAVVFPGVASQALRVAGMRTGMSISRRLIRSQSAERLIEAVLRHGGRWLGVRYARKAVISKGIPLIGAGIGSGWNWLEVHAVGQRAVSYYMHRPIAPAIGGGTPTPWTRVRQLLRLTSGSNPD